MNPSLRQELLQLDPMTPSQRESYELQREQLLSRTLGLGGRLRYLVPALAGLLLGFGLVSLALSEPVGTPWSTRALLLALGVGGFFWCCVCGRILLRGRVRLRSDRRLISGAAMAFSALQFLAFAWRALGPPLRDQPAPPGGIAGLIVSGICVLLAAGLLLAQGQRESELRLREDLLRSRLATGQDAQPSQDR